MKPLTLPASTVTTALAGALVTLVVWAAKQWGHVDLPPEIASALTVVVTVLVAHFTPDAPVPPTSAEQVRAKLAAGK